MANRTTSTLDAPASETGTEATHPLAETGREAGERAGHLVERGAEIGFKQADRGLQTAASGVETVAESIRRVSTEMQTDQPQIADIASTAADQAEALAGYLRETDVRQIIGNVESFARRQPLLFLGGAFVFGMAASRFIKAADGSGPQGPWQGQGIAAGEGDGYSSGQGYGYDTGHWSPAGQRSGGTRATGPGAGTDVLAVGGTDAEL